MGQRDSSYFTGLTTPEDDEIEVTVVGPGYGECVLVHIGHQRWVVVDSCLDSTKQPAALTYLSRLGVDPSESVCLIVATHWHDDHIRGMARLVEECKSAEFCCASALVKEEFLAVLGSLEQRSATPSGSGARELFRVFNLISERAAGRTYALANRRIFDGTGCTIWSLSPSDHTYEVFLRRIGKLVPELGQPKRRVPALLQNDTSVVLLIEFDQDAVLLGADMEKQGWTKILEDGQRPSTRASVFKVPHHGSQDAHELRVWVEMLNERPVAALTPWRCGSGSIPTEADVERIRSLTENAYITSLPSDAIRAPRRRNSMVERSIRESGIDIRRVALSEGIVRSRKKMGTKGAWRIYGSDSAKNLIDI